MSEINSPSRPDTPIAAALEAQERVIILFLGALAANMPDPRDYIERTRLQMMDAMAKNATPGSHHLQVADHLDWIWAMVSARLDQKGL